MLAALRGYPFECYVHRRLPSGGQYAVRCLSSDVRAHLRTLPEIVPRIFSSLDPNDPPEQRPDWNDGRYNRPASRNFASVASAVYPNEFDQITV